MDFWEFLKQYGTMATLAGGAFAVVKQMFAFAWRLAQVEQQSQRHEETLDGLKAPIDKVSRSVIRIEEQLSELRRRRRTDREELDGEG